MMVEFTSIEPSSGSKWVVKVDKPQFAGVYKGDEVEVKSVGPGGIVYYGPNGDDWSAKLDVWHQNFTPVPEYTPKDIKEPDDVKDLDTTFMSGDRVEYIGSDTWWEAWSPGTVFKGGIRLDNYDYQTSDDYHDTPPWEDFVLIHETDAVNSPSHYGQGEIEAITYIEDFLTKEEYIGYLRGNIAKYLHRWRFKGKPEEDLKKAQVYLGWLIKKVGEE